ncbi:dihydroneopterin triphosphate diphosphatase [Leeia aquatica]|uniref:Dihydroneopterin triphosphate diphosphatase n=1 Tax=Leeia aquatica TaxID=2725557 RepID=A0A847SDQ1_9NEIS|nr:dihydroneopterin triphosphate diphosphatase [Leeia aquatica]NLR75429.1 dihydroneopterin triphosphate diphosphatase [Leeia aquatica]
MPYKQAVSVLVVIHTPDLQVLLLERAGHPGYWQSVTGSREGEESLMETARREVQEETGLSSPPAQLQDWQYAVDYEIYEEWRHRYAPGTRYNREHWFALCVPETQAVTLAVDEHIAYRWLPWAAAAEVVFSPSNADAIRSLPDRLHR